jgi:hypothetical protein
MRTLKTTIEGLANEFAVSIISALRTASIDELTGLGAQGVRANGRAPLVLEGRKRGRGERLGRRSTADIGRMVDNIVTLLQKHPEGLRAEQIRETLDCQAKELPRPLADGLAEGRISKAGQKRATTYFAGGKVAAEGGSVTTKKRRSSGGRRKRP